MGRMPGFSIWGLPDGATFPIRGIVRKLRSELEEHIRNQTPHKAEAVLSALN